MNTNTIIIIVVVLLAVAGIIWFGFFNNTAEDVIITETIDTDVMGDTGVDEVVEPTIVDEEHGDDITEDIIMDTTTNPIVTLHTTKGNIGIELFIDTMPITAGNFLKLTKDGYYDGIKFHRVISNFMIQGGDPNSKGDNTATYGTGGPGYAIEDEFVDGISNVRGTISMANAGPNTGGSQFFINLVDNTNLDFDKEPLSSKHPVFGKVVEGLDVVDAIGSVATGVRDLPVDPVIIESISVN